MAKKITLTTIAEMLTTQGTEIRDLTETVGFVVKHMATKDDVADLRRELKGDIASVQIQVNSVERQLRETKTEVRLGDLEEKSSARPAARPPTTEATKTAQPHAQPSSKIHELRPTGCPYDVARAHLARSPTALPGLRAYEPAHRRRTRLPTS
jgi:hypothetical protein